MDGFVVGGSVCTPFYSLDTLHVIQPPAYRISQNQPGYGYALDLPTEAMPTCRLRGSSTPAACGQILKFSSRYIIQGHQSRRNNVLWRCATACSRAPAQ